LLSCSASSVWRLGVRLPDEYVRPANATSHEEVVRGDRSGDEFSARVREPVTDRSGTDNDGGTSHGEESSCSNTTAAPWFGRHGGEDFLPSAADLPLSLRSSAAVFDSRRGRHASEAHVVEHSLGTREAVGFDSRLRLCIYLSRIVSRRARVLTRDDAISGPILSTRMSPRMSPLRDGGRGFLIH
jgi:hypothetical protein